MKFFSDERANSSLKRTIPSSLTLRVEAADGQNQERCSNYSGSLHLVGQFKCKAMLEISPVQLKNQDWLATTASFPVSSFYTGC